MLPLETLESLRGKKTTIELHDGRSYTGTLIAFDLNINVHMIVNGKDIFFNGYNVSDVSPAQKGESQE